MIDLREDGGGSDVGGGGGDVVGIDVIGVGDGGVGEVGVGDVGINLCAGRACPASQMCCPATGACVPAGCTSCCIGPPTDAPIVVGDGFTEAGVQTCLRDTDCSPSSATSSNVCVFLTAGCSVRGECRVNYAACGRVSLPYCGCDGVTFFDTCAGPNHPWVSMSACPDGGTISDASAVCPPCASGTVCCTSGRSAGTCYDPRCLACCM